jgi:hypothetical protein
MSRIRILMVAVLAASALGVLAVPAGAAAPAANTKSCKAITQALSTKVASKADVKGFIARVKQAAKSAPTNVRSALNKIASIGARVSSSAQARALVTNKDYGKAVGVVESYLIQCAGATVPTT